MHDHRADRRRGRESGGDVLSIRSHAAGRAKADWCEGIDRDVGGHDFLSEDLRQALNAGLRRSVGRHPHRLAPGLRGR